jgi:DNA-binding winged helix-turn-helix (wHTH) protein
MRFAFGDHELDEERLELRRDGLKVSAQPKTLDILFHLIRNRDRVVLKRELLDAVWPGVTVSEAALSRAILRARRAIADELQQALVTVHGRGFRFAAPVVVLASGAGSSSEPEVDEAFVGRTACMSALEAHLEDAFAGKGSVVWLTGDEGIGKTRAAEELARRARRRGASVCVARAHEDVEAPPFRLWSQITRSLVAERVDPAATVFLRDAASLVAGAPSAAGDEAPLFDSFARFLVETSRAAPLVLLLDDLHWADEPSLRLLRFLAREMSEGAVLLIGVLRDTAPAGASGRGRSLSALVREHAKHQIALRGLPLEEVARFVELAAGVAPSQPLARDLLDRSGGNPLYLHQLLKTDRIERALNDAAVELATTMDLEQGLIQSVSRHLDDLSSGSRELLKLASVLGRELEVAKVAAVSGLAHDEVLNRLDEAARSRLLAKTDGRGYRFEPVLVRDVLYGTLRSAERAAMHRAAAERLLAYFGESASLHAAELARHLTRALPGSDASLALDLAVRAAKDATSRGAHKRAAKHWALAVQALDHLRGEKPRRLEVHLGLADAHARAGNEAVARDAYLDAAMLARTLDAPLALADAAIGFNKVARSGQVDLGRALIDEALAAMVEAPGDCAERLAEIRALRAKSPPPMAEQG